ncbi:hypothetical protein AD945_14350 [Gluconobacter albidus]|uniref:Uncharacterized protein n=2 Tax=Gluconobacter albidus TaxID=318683 RepID=A0A149TFH3_9PROT|nr:hypothetical protein AD945_14350 [Gluconobacter albidus]
MRTAIDLRTLEPAEISVEQSDASGERWPSCMANLYQHARRIAPDAPTYIVERRQGDPLGRCCSSGPVLIFGRANVYDQATLFHELWHYAETQMLSQPDRDIVYGEIGDRCTRWDSDYLDSVREQSARAFEHYASARAHGLMLPRARRGTAQHVFERLYDGKEHARITRWLAWAEVHKNAAIAVPYLGIGSFTFFMMCVLPHLVTH